ncbi:TetR/AcrR family transcriptional regulator [Lysinibacillus xylanilyticus]|uniref:TetR/AcrR family transcriptional regulator n=1 Tax=Lysinibacillus xylanilyticus TaxID=582475 RepID=UPI002B2483E6|nr:TetR/AcrR family transcriptional regulator [Lysinibacillus xylanilyticus]MEB2301713.1 TetR/AcrR family transcriptional regulator [Lysinibacillus xylanilyticus]
MPRKEEQNQELRDARKEQILQAALIVFARRGMVATKISDIAKEAGLSHGLVYHYFDSKEEIFSMLVKKAANSSIEVIQKANDHIGTPLEKLKWMTEQILNSLIDSEHTLLFLIMIQASTSDAIPDEVKELLTRDYAQSPVGCTLPMIVAGQEEGELISTNPVTLAVTYFAFIQGLAINKIQWPECPIPDANMLMKIFTKE